MGSPLVRDSVKIQQEAIVCDDGMCFHWEPIFSDKIGLQILFKNYFKYLLLLSAFHHAGHSRSDQEN